MDLGIDLFWLVESAVAVVLVLWQLERARRVKLAASHQTERVRLLANGKVRTLGIYLLTAALSTTAAFISAFFWISGFAAPEWLAPLSAALLVLGGGSAVLLDELDDRRLV